MLDYINHITGPPNTADFMYKPSFAIFEMFAAASVSMLYFSK